MWPLVVPLHWLCQALSHMAHVAADPTAFIFPLRGGQHSAAAGLLGLPPCPLWDPSLGCRVAQHYFLARLLCPPHTALPTLAQKSVFEEPLSSPIDNISEIHWHLKPAKDQMFRDLLGSGIVFECACSPTLSYG